MTTDIKTMRATHWTSNGENELVLHSVGITSRRSWKVQGISVALRAAWSFSNRLPLSFTDFCCDLGILGQRSNEKLIPPPQR